MCLLFAVIPYCDFFKCYFLGINIELFMNEKTGHVGFPSK